MKYVLIFLLVLVVAWRWRSLRAARHAAPAAKARAPQAPGAAIAMVDCRHCGMHIPRQEAIAGQRGMYCSAAHQHRAES